MVPGLMPHTISDSAFHQASHFFALQENVRAGAWFSCVSEATRQDLLKVFPEAEPRAMVIHNIASDEYFVEEAPPEMVLQILRNRQVKVPGIAANREPAWSLGLSSAGSLDYLLIVSTIEPRKNHLMLIAAWERLRYTSMPQLKLVVVGNLGWGFRPVLDAFRPWAERGDLIHLAAVPSAELRVLYRHAAATICPSLAEGFDYSGIEAMRCGGIVLSSDIPVHREVFGTSSVYFDPYSAEDAAGVIAQVLAPDGLSIRERLHAEGPTISDRYTADSILPQWSQFLDDLRCRQATQ
jgi:glycosyltransferase involved in cell wall biosynthesis